MKKTLGMILAGGKGTRLEPLTLERAKPAVPFGGKYRIIDFALSNMVNSGIHHVLVLTQYESRSLEDHVRKAWTTRAGIGQSIYTLPSIEKRGKKGRYEGTSDAIYKNIDRIERANPDRVAIFGGDHIYSMDISKMVEAHNGGNDLTIAAKKIELSDEDFEVHKGKKRLKFGVIIADRNNKVIGFQEKPEIPKEIENEPGNCWASMGNYIFTASILIKELKKEYGTDFGNHIIPQMKDEGRKISIYPFDGYWQDVGTLDSYFQTSMDLNRENPELDLYNLNWRFLTLGGIYPPTRLYHEKTISTIGGGCQIQGNIENCVLSPGVKIGKNSYVRDSIVFDDVEIGEDVRIKNAIIDKFNKIKAGEQIGYDKKQDSDKGYYLSTSGLVVVPRGVIK